MTGKMDHNGFTDTRTANSRVLLPRGVYGFTNQLRGVCAGARVELLRAPVADLSHVQIALSIDTHSVNVEQPAGNVGQRAPGIQQVPIEVVLDDLSVEVVGGPKGGDRRRYKEN